MRSAFRDISLSNRLWLGFGSVLLLGATAVAVLWSGQHELALQLQQPTRQAATEALQALAWQHWLVAGLALAALLSAVVTARSIHRSVQRPLAEAMTAVQALAAGDLEHRVKVERLDEMGQLLVAIDDMSNWLAVLLNDDGPDMTPAASAGPSGPPTRVGRHELLDELNHVEVRGRPPARQPVRHTRQTDIGLGVT